MKSLNSYVFGSTNIYESAVPLYYLLKFFGLAPFHVDVTKEKCGIRLQDYFVFLLVFIIYIIIFFTALFDSLTYEYKANSILEIGYIYQYITMIFYTVFIILYGFFKRKHITKLLELLHNYDETVNILNWHFKVTHSKDRKMVIVWIVTILLSSGILFCLLIIPSSDALIFRQVVYSIYITLAHIIVLFQFTLSCSAVKMRYEILNKNMSLKFPQINHGTQILKVSSDNRTYFIKKTAWLHDTLYEALTEINSIFSVEIVFVILSTVMSQVFGLYNIIQTFKKGDIDEATIKALSNNCLWLVWETIPILLAIRCASKTTEYVSFLIIKTQFMLYSLFLLQRLKLFSLQLQSHQPVLSCGFFPIDYTLVFLISGSVTTYLVILSQFE
ncbi:unnamed protein product [Diamesa serratosioi]